MDNSIHIEQLTTDKIEEFAANPAGLSGLIFSNSDEWKGTDRVPMSNHNGWHIVHYLLAGDVWGGAWPLNFMAAVNVGRPVSYDEEYLTECVVPDYEEIRNFVADAASRDRGLLVARTMM